MLDTTGKLQEMLIRSCLHAGLTTAGGLFERRYGFRMDRSTVDIIQKIVEVPVEGKLHLPTHLTLSNTYCQIFVLLSQVEKDAGGIR